MAKEADWTKDEDAVLRETYALSSISELCVLFPSRSWSAIKQHAYNKLKLKKEVTSRTKSVNINRLLLNEAITYYWIGYLLADGNFDSLGRVSVSASEKDADHIKAFARFIENPVVSRSVRKTTFSNASVMYKTTCYSSYYGPLIMKKFGILPNKTENPPPLDDILNGLTKELALALVIGFIDGDGYIGLANKGKSNFIRLEMHSSWLKNLQTLESFVFSALSEISPNTAKINNKGYASLSITRASVIQKLLTISDTLPSMERKWIKILKNESKL